MRTLSLIAAAALALAGGAGRASAQTQDLVETAVAAARSHAREGAHEAASSRRSRGRAVHRVRADGRRVREAPAGALEKCSPTRRAAPVLLYHVVPGRVLAADVMKRTRATTAAAEREDRREGRRGHGRRREGG
jgi:hypothetical protein